MNNHITTEVMAVSIKLVHTSLRMKVGSLKVLGCIDDTMKQYHMSQRE